MGLGKPQQCVSFKLLASAVVCVYLLNCFIGAKMIWGINSFAAEYFCFCVGCGIFGAKYSKSEQQQSTKTHIARTDLECDNADKALF